MYLVAAAWDSVGLRRYWKGSATLTGIVTPEPFQFLDRGQDEFHLERILLLVFPGDLTQ